MKTISKLLVASALVVSFAAPSLADVQFEGLTQDERNAYTNPQPANNWSKAYAMEAPAKADKMSSVRWHRVANTSRDFGASTIQ